MCKRDRWTTDPWTVVESDGRLYGRGTCDMKGYVALAVWALVEAQGRGVSRPLQLALSYDEELGCTGAPPMIETMKQVLPQGSVALIGEPSRMALINGHKGGTGYHVHVKGFEVHSSLLPLSLIHIYMSAWGPLAAGNGRPAAAWVKDGNGEGRGARVSPARRAPCQITSRGSSPVHSTVRHPTSS